MLIKLIEIFSLFWVTAAIIPYLWPNRMNAKQKELLNQVEFYGNENGLTMSTWLRNRPTH